MKDNHYQKQVHELESTSVNSREQGFQLVKKFPVFPGILGPIAVLKTSRLSTLFYAKSIQVSTLTPYLLKVQFNTLLQCMLQFYVVSSVRVSQ
jgi:hypothetical protein